MGVLSRWKSDIQEVWVSYSIYFWGQEFFLRKILSGRAFCPVFRCVVYLGWGTCVYTPLLNNHKVMPRLRRLSRNMWCRLGTIPRCNCRFYGPGHTGPPQKQKQLDFGDNVCKVTECKISQMCIPERSFATRSCKYLWCICNHLTLQKYCRLVAIKLSVSLKICYFLQITF